MFNSESNLDFIDIVSVLSFLIGMENLDLNEKQNMNLVSHLKRQDYVLEKEQNEMLRRIIKLLNKIIIQNKFIIEKLKETGTDENT